MSMRARENKQIQKTKHEASGSKMSKFTSNISRLLPSNGLRQLQRWKEINSIKTTHSSNTGLQAELAVIETLKKSIQPIEIWHQKRVPLGNNSGSREIDICALTKSCLFVIEVKHWKDLVSIENENLIQVGKESTKPYPLKRVEDISNQIKQIVTSRTGSIVEEVKSFIVLSHKECVYEPKEFENKVILIEELIDFIQKEDASRQDMDSEVFKQISKTLSDLPTWDALHLANGEIIYGEILQKGKISPLLTRKASTHYAINATSNNLIHNLLFGFTLEATLPQNVSHSVVFRNPERESIAVNFPWGGSKNIPLMEVREIVFGWQNQFVWTPQIAENRCSLSSKIRYESFNPSEVSSLEVGEIVIGKICGFLNYGVLVQLSANMKGLIQLSSFRMAKEMFDQFIREGVQVRTKVLKFTHSKKIDLEFLELI